MAALEQERSLHMPISLELEFMLSSSGTYVKLLNCVGTSHLFLLQNGLLLTLSFLRCVTVFHKTINQLLPS